MTSSIETIVKVENVSVAYGRAIVLKEANLSLMAGETFGLIGLNGAGKTSLIKAMMGLRPVNSGSIRLFDASPGDRAQRSRLAFLPERFEPPWFLSGAEFVKFSLRLYGREVEMADLVAFAEAVALDPAALKRRVHTYSKGMRQKLGLMGTLLTGCDLMILDEPMSGLDPLARKLVKDAILQRRRPGQTIFLSSHILADMDEMCDRVAIMHEGEIRFVGTPTEFKRVTASENLERAFLQFIEKRKAA